MPQPYRRPAPGSLAEQVILTARAEYAEVEPWQDETGRGGLAVAARPVVWQGKLAKVAVVAVPYGDRAVLQRQGFTVRRQPLSGFRSLVWYGDYDEKLTAAAMRFPRRD